MTKRIFFIVIVMLAIVATAILFRSSNQAILLQGEVDAPEVIVMSKAKGRITDILVQRGDDVKQGQLLIKLDNPELGAQVNAAQAVLDQAKAQLDQSLHGAREESIRNLEAMLAQAKLSLETAKKEYDRNAKIAREGYVSSSNLDNFLKIRNTATQQVNVAQANLDEALHGDRIELKARYEAAVRQAEGQLLQLQILQKDLNVTAPVEGEVGVIPAEIGELFNAGSPLLTLNRLWQSYFVFNIREDILLHIRKGDNVNLIIPAISGDPIETEIRFISPVGDFATKRATRATGDFDLKTFEVRLYPTKQIDGLRGGMSALWHWDK